MHVSALNSFLDFKNNYLRDKNSEIKIVEIGSQSINESISVPGKRSITLPLGKTEITRPIKSLDIILRT